MAAGPAGAVTLRVRECSVPAGEARGMATEGACGGGLLSRGRRRGFCTWREGPSGTGTLVESHFCQFLICKPVGVRFPSQGFTWWGGDGGGEHTQGPRRALVLRCPKWHLRHPPAPHPPHPPPADLGNNARGAGQGSRARVNRASRLARVLRPRTPPEAGLPPSDRPGSLTRTVLRTMVNKEQLFAAFDEWDSASYRPHSESSIRYSLRTRCWASGPWLHSVPGLWAGHSCRRRRSHRHRARLAGAGANRARLTVVQQEQMFVELLDGGD